MRRVAIIGAGIGREHLTAYRALPEHFEVAVICDLDRARATEIAGGIPVETDLATVLASDVDIIDVCLPPHLHVSTAIAALEAGKDVICEKPIATSLSDMDRLEAVASKTGRRVYPVFQYRFGVGVAQVLHLIRAGLAGTAFAGSIETHWRRDADYYDAPWRGTWAGEQGGVILGHAIHAHDLMCLLLGPVAQVSAQLATRVNDIETEDCAALGFTMESGALVTSSATLGAGDDTSRIRLMFDGFTAESGLSPYAPAAAQWTITPRGCSAEEINAALKDVVASPLGFEGFLQAIALDLDAVTLAQGRTSVELVTALYAAARAGAPQRLPLPRTHALYDGWQP
ncbi:Gfo/Idh/MocA family protein [Litoreibacter albidus]|uniref:Predicted dehydrogenase n=1 Tax=Litoreibacter albidus TaxID=670155 RepID=A0A1H2YVM7_9RHOB|nr:Gfo/Idh/MocA family oxidoreductase [Litoreibacter albidus]SDX09107.1 Predicted dehydrogenase [Litoreibacter albidus]